jgi:xylan 1,4-beta-xylosidase
MAPSNPVLPGFHPDPSICRVGTDFYLVTSTFEYFPGLPVHHSRDLVNWRAIGHVLDRPTQLNLDGVRSSGGLYAPTIRWHRGVFYVVCTLVGAPEGQTGGNFVVTATDPAGPWSEPVWLGELDSFDPSLLFIDDEAWFCATRPDPESRVTGGTEIWVQAFDVPTLSLVGPQTVIWHGAMLDVVWAEAPHLYRVPDGILLVIAEGGTAFHHSVTCARADQVTGPYRNGPTNPVLTHRHLGERYPVVGAGHADLVDAADGTWWAVALAMRTRWADDGYHYPMGRETFLAEVRWEDGWPVVNPGTGSLREQQAGLGGALPSSPAGSVRDDFDRASLGAQWSFVRTPREPIYSLTERPGWLTLYPQPTSIVDVGCPAFICRPQDSWDFTASGLLDFTPRTEQDVAGIVLRQNEDFSLQLLVSLDSAGQRVARAVRRFAGADEVAAVMPVADGPLRLSVTGAGLEYQLAVNDVSLAKLDGRGLSTSLAGGFTGTMLGPYAHVGSPPTDPVGAPPTDPAGFPLTGSTRVPLAYWDWFEYRAT